MKHLVIACLLLATCPALAESLDAALADVRHVQIGSDSGNAPPEPADDYVSTLWQTAVEIPLASLLSNDVDPDGDRLRILRFGQPTHGTLTLTSSGTVTYVPPNGCEVGQDRFGYSVSDGQSRAAATVHVAIGGIVCPSKPPNQ